MKRHWFLSLVLWSNLVGNILYAFVSFYIHFSLSIIYIIASVACILLLNWKIIGFYIFCVAYFLTIFINLLFGEGFIFSIIVFIIQVVILYGLLNLKKDGVSTWDYLKNNNQILSDENIKKKCSSCNTSYSKLYNTCPSCGSSMFSIYENLNAKENIIKNDKDMKKCKRCNALVSSDEYKCSKCKGESFI